MTPPDADVVCLKVLGEDRGSVWFWTHDAFANTDPFKRLADSFEGVLRGAAANR
jgi:hypothetical protein